MPSACPAPTAQEAEQRCAALSSAGPSWSLCILAPRGQLVPGGPPADRRSLWELGTHALWTKAQLLTLTISFSWPGI